MRPLALALALLVLFAFGVDPAAAQRQRWPGDGDDPGGQATGRTAVPRHERPREAPSPPPPAPRETSPAPPPVQRTVAGDDQDRARPRGSRSRGDDPPTGVAVPRPPDWPPAARGDRAYVYYPRYYYPYGYGAFGLGYFYYDPYLWYPGYDWRFSGYGFGYATGELRLRVEPRDAEVFVDGYYAGVVDDFDGMFQALRLEEGPYTIEIVAPGYEPLEFRVRIQPGRKITYRGELRPKP